MSDLAMVAISYADVGDQTRDKPVERLCTTNLVNWKALMLTVSLKQTEVDIV